MVKPKKSKLASTKNVALVKQLAEGKVTKRKSKEKVQLRAEESSVLDSKTSKKILAAAKAQQLEFNEDNFPSLERKRTYANINIGEGIDDESKDVTENDFMDNLEIGEEDAKAFERFQNPQEGKRTLKLSDIIMEKIQEKQQDIQSKLTEDGSLKIEDVDPSIFCSVLSHAMAQRFFNLVLLPRIRDDLCEYKKLNMHLYNALKKALFKPAAFMKGIILPLLEAGDCTLREAIIFGSVIARSSIPVLHSSACLLKICEMGYTGANSIFIRYFLDKRYALPYRVIDAAVFHFIRFENDKLEMPVLWHQSLLTFAQRYKNDISSEQKEALLNLLRKQSHPKITPEIRRELLAASCRDVEMMECDNEITALPVEIYTDKDVCYE
ncbi:bystin isoform X2 [Rhagoletis pomonella]|uniref:bystin isoform X2 n=1 Tax=Rhagoletis pomonella TaxID=28610 RepID=UPI00177A8DBB|nr:bystin isoform X2 [Rhagoletis pomonella]